MHAQDPERRMEEEGLRRDHPPWGVISRFVSLSFFLSFFLFWRGFCYRALTVARQTERDRETGSERSPPRGDGQAAIPSPPFSSQDLGHARTCAQHEFKPPCLGLEPQSTMWESSNIAITLTAGPALQHFLK